MLNPIHVKGLSYTLHFNTFLVGDNVCFGSCSPPYCRCATDYIMRSVSWKVILGRQQSRFLQLPHIQSKYGRRRGWKKFGVIKQFAHLSHWTITSNSRLYRGQVGAIGLPRETGHLVLAWPPHENADRKQSISCQEAGVDSLLRDLPCVALACIYQMLCRERYVLELCMLSLREVRAETLERPMNSRYFNLS